MLFEASLMNLLHGADVPFYNFLKIFEKSSLPDLEFSPNGSTYCFIMFTNINVHNVIVS
jgi:hypothetical protein